MKTIIMIWSGLAGLISTLGAQNIFHPPLRVQAGGHPIKTNPPGFACPSLADVNGDGRQDLVVGQFQGGRISVFLNALGPDKKPFYTRGVWLSSNRKPIEVPGVY